MGKDPSNRHQTGSGRETSPPVLLRLKGRGLLTRLLIHLQQLSADNPAGSGSIGQMPGCKFRASCPQLSRVLTPRAGQSGGFSAKSVPHLFFKMCLPRCSHSNIPVVPILCEIRKCLHSIE